MHAPNTLPDKHLSRRRPALRLAFLFLLCLWFPASALRSQSAPPSAAAPGVAGNAAAFRAELQRVQAILLRKPQTPGQIAALETSLPSTWTVDTPDGKYEVSSEPLRFLLDDAGKNAAQRDARIAQAQAWAGEMIVQVSAYASQAIPPETGARARLDQILRRREFAADFSPTAWQKFQQRLRAWIGRIFGNLWNRMGQHPVAARTLFWLLMVGAVVCLALFVFRIWSQRARMQPLQAPASSVVRQSWQEWIRDARLAADRGDFRHAVHAVYWAGVVYLEDSGALPRERSRTPRERVRQLLATAPDRSAGGTQRRETLAGLTVHLERAWYAGIPATESDFQDSLQLVEILGCPWR
jgi:Domain of unknown function (DUF4129)